MRQFIVFLSEIGLEDLRRTGGKGANLGFLMQEGFNVPPGFCVTTPAFDIFLSQRDLDKHIGAILEAVDFEDLSAVEQGAAALRRIMLSTPVPGDLEEEIAAAYDRLVSEHGTELVAVRSSVATRDLALTSFPGQMDTYHNLRGETEVVEKVRECWASVFSYPALVSRRTAGIDHFDVFIAPVVQLMVDADSAGVIFTSDQLESRRDVMVINSCFGLGEGVVSGTVNCDHFVADRSSAALLDTRTGDKKFEIVLDRDRGRGNVRSFLSDEDRTRLSLTSGQIRQLVTKARDIEERYGVPQDIEWAFKGDELFILQSRAISVPDAALKEVAENAREWISEFDSRIDPRYDEFTLSNISEVLPGVLTPLSISDIDSLDYGFLKCNTDLGLMKRIKPESDMIFLGIFYGRAHLNLSVVKEMVSQLPGANIKDFDRREDAGGGEGLWRPTLRNMAILPGILARLTYKAAVTPKKARSLGDKYERMIEMARRKDCSVAPYEEIFAIIERSRRELFEAMAIHITISQLAVTYFDFLCRITRKWLDDDTGMLAARLVTGLQNLESAAPSEHIWELSRLVLNSARLREIFEAGEPQTIQKLLEEDDSPDVAYFQGRLGSFLDLFGYRGIFEAEAMFPNWDEDPSYIFSTIKNYLSAPPESSPRRIARRQEREREDALSQAMDRLRGPRRALLRYLMKQSQTYISLREYMKSILIKGLTHGKKVYRVVSRRLADRGLIADPSDIYFLTNREVEALATGGGRDIPVAELVARRRVEYERNLTVVLPEYSKGRPRPLSARELAPREDVEVISGIGVSPGEVTGRARVITDPCRNAKINPGEVLVAPVTDAAWTPLFVTAAATVVEVGGPLSHGSIVAREFGMPCVVNAASATRIIHTGQVITVDGNLGKVYLHPTEK